MLIVGFGRLQMKKLRDLFSKIVDLDDTELSLKIEEAQRQGDPYAHHWYRTTNYLMVCHKCGATHLDKVSDGCVYNKCTVHTNHPSN